MINYEPNNEGVDLRSIEALSSVTEKYSLNRYTLIISILLAICLSTATLVVSALIIEPGPGLFMFLYLTMAFPAPVIFGFWVSQLYFYRNSEEILEQFSFLCESNERLITYSFGTLPRYDNRTPTSMRYYFFSTKRVFSIEFSRNIKSSFQIENAILDQTITDNIVKIYSVGYSVDSVQYGWKSDFSNFGISSTHLQLKNEGLRHALLHKFTRNGRLIRQIFNIAQPTP